MGFGPQSPRKLRIMTSHSRSILVLRRGENRDFDYKGKRKEILRLKVNRSREEERKKDGESGDVLRDDARSLRVLAVHGQAPCLDRSPSRRKGLFLSLIFTLLQ